MASVRKQILDLVEGKLNVVLADLGWTKVRRNPRDIIPQKEMNAIVMMDGGDAAPSPLTGHVEERTVEFSVALLVKETEGTTVEELLDEGYVAVCDALTDPDDTQLGGIAVSVDQGEVGDPMYGRPEAGAHFLGAQWIDFSVRYLAREGAASVVGP